MTKALEGLGSYSLQFYPERKKAYQASASISDSTCERLDQQAVFAERVRRCSRNTQALLRAYGMVNPDSCA